MMIIEFDSPLTKNLIVDITYHDSNEEPENDCTNTVVSIKVGDKVYQYFNQESQKAFEKFKGMLISMSKVSPIIHPGVCYGVITKFNSEYFIDWSVIERNYHLSSSKKVV